MSLKKLKLVLNVLMADVKKVNRLSKQKSVMTIQDNPHEAAAASTGSIKAENLNDAILIDGVELLSLLTQLKLIE